MEMDTEKTYVWFGYEFEDKSDITAFFAPVYYEGGYGFEYTCYAHIGQHSDYSMEYAKECKEATPEDYKDLFEELTSIGYNLEVVPLHSLKSYTEYVSLI
jgi:hypothetical protein